MWWYLIPGLVAALSLAVMLFVVRRTFPRLVMIDVTTIAQERDAARKHRIVVERAERLRASLFLRIRQWLRPRINQLRAVVHAWHERASEVERRYRRISASAEGGLEKARLLVEEGVALGKEGKQSEAEQKFIAAVSLAPKFAKAYEELGRLYALGKQWDEALEAFHFLIKMDPKDASAHANIGELEVARGRPKNSIPHFEKAVEIKPANPRLLSLLLDAAIQAGDKERALKTFARLKAVASQFPGIVDLEQRIRRM